MTDQERTLMLGLVKSFQESLKEGRLDDVDPNHIMKCASICMEYAWAEDSDGYNPLLDRAMERVFGTTCIYLRGSPVFLKNIGDEFLYYLRHVMDVEVEKIK